MEIESTKKIDILLKLLEENRKSAEWLKDLDLKIARYSLALYLAAIAWLTAHPPTKKWPWYSADIIIAVLGSAFLFRNSSRHQGFNEELGRIRTALGLEQEGVYHPKAIGHAKPTDIAFYVGRVLYWLYVIAGALFWIVVYSLCLQPIMPDSATGGR